MTSKVTAVAINTLRPNIMNMVVGIISLYNIIQWTQASWLEVSFFKTWVGRHTAQKLLVGNHRGTSCSTWVSSHTLLYVNLRQSSSPNHPQNMLYRARGFRNRFTETQQKPPITHFTNTELLNKETKYMIFFKRHGDTCQLRTVTVNNKLHTPQST
jgi:hypothetical protein